MKQARPCDRFGLAIHQFDDPLSQTANAVLRGKSFDPETMDIMSMASLSLTSQIGHGLVARTAHQGAEPYFASISSASASNSVAMSIIMSALA